MYKRFYDNIKLLSLLIGYFSVLKSYYFNSTKKEQGEDYKIANEANKKFNKFCKSFIKDLEGLLGSDKRILAKKEELKNLRQNLRASQAIKNQPVFSEICDSLRKIEEFIEFLQVEVPQKEVDEASRHEILAQVNIFKYQTYLA